MRMGIGLHLEQTQKLIITPELRQAITILQLSTQELSDYLDQELLENPVLEIKEDSDERESRENSPEENERFDVNWQEYFSDGSDLGYIRSPREQRSEENSFEQYTSEAPTLQEHLLFQLHLAVPQGQMRAIGEFLTGNIDEHGYLCTGIKEAADHLNCSSEQVCQVLKIIQGFDPLGVAARDLTECLLIQLQQLEKNNPLAERIIKYYLEDLASGRIGKIAKALGINPVQVQEIGDLIRTLDPKPGRKFGSNNETRYIIPDVVIEKVSGEYIVLVNDSNGPRLGINHVYRALLNKDIPCDESTRKFVEGKLNSAMWIIKSIEQRRLTLYRVVNSIVNFQRDFLEKGIKHLKPLTLKRVADTLEMHESTVSRAISNKYVQTTQGVYELKFFFASGVENLSGTSMAAESIKRLLQESIAAEDSASPLTDQRLTDLLNRQGISISRRTVAKYRDELGIPAAGKRKRF